MVQYKHIFFSRTTIQWYKKKFAASLISGFTFTMACPQPACPLFTRESLEANPLLPPYSVSMLQKVRSHEWTINSNGSKSLGHLHPPIHITNYSVSISIVLLSRLSLLWVLPESHHERILSHSHWCHQVQPNSTLNNKKTQSSAHLINPCFIYNRNHIKYLNWIVTNTFWIQR